MLAIFHILANPILRYLPPHLGYRQNPRLETPLQFGSLFHLRLWPWSVAAGMCMLQLLSRSPCQTVPGNAKVRSLCLYLPDFRQIHGRRVGLTLLLRLTVEWEYREHNPRDEGRQTQWLTYWVCRPTPHSIPAGSRGRVLSAPPKSPIVVRKLTLAR